MKTLFIVWASALTVATAPNPYENIVLRNVFNLVSPKPETSKPAELPRPRAEYTLTGIAGFGSNKWALLSKADPRKPSQQLIMREGEREGALEILKVDEIANLVRLRDDGSVVELTFSTNAVAYTDLATKKFVDEHTRAHELREQRERIRRQREGAPVGVVVDRKLGEILSPPEQAVLESQR